MKILTSICAKTTTNKITSTHMIEYWLSVDPLLEKSVLLIIKKYIRLSYLLHNVRGGCYDDDLISSRYEDYRMLLYGP